MEHFARVDTATDKLVGTIPDTKGVHGIAVANDLGKGYTSDGADNDVTVFDLKTLKVLGKVKTGQNPDAIIYEPVSHRVFAFNGRSNDATAIDAKAGSVITASIPLGGKPEFAQIDGKGHVYVNIENTNEIVEIDAETVRHVPSPNGGTGRDARLLPRHASRHLSDAGRLTTQRRSRQSYTTRHFDPRHSACCQHARVTTIGGSNICRR
jgi:YVTN family beta-propeller protein